MNKNSNFQRVGFLAFVPGLVAKLGADPLAVLSAVGLGAHALEDKDSTIPYSTAAALLHHAAEMTHCFHFGLQFGALIRTSTLGAIGQLMRTAPTLGAAFQDLATHQHRNAHGAAIYLTMTQSEAFFGYAVYERRVQGHSVICDAAAMATYSVTCELLGVERLDVGEIHFSRSAPKDVAPYKKLIVGQLRFDSEQTGVRMKRSLLGRALRTANPEVRTIVEKSIADALHIGALDIESQVRRSLRVGLTTGTVSANETAEQLGIGRRTLQRRLDEAGHPFQQLLDETRCEFAQQLLSGTRLSISEISHVVGYNHPGVLTRAFIRWAGVTPSEWRTQCEST